MRDQEGVWQDLVRSSESYFNAFRAFFHEGMNRVEMVKQGLNGGSMEVLTALGMLPYMDVGERLQTFDRLVFLCLSQKYAHFIRPLISALPRAWVLDHIEEVAEPLLHDSDSISYRMLLELFLVLDANLAMRLARRAAAHPDVDVAEAGDDYISMLAVVNNNKRFYSK
jgi:hypothetical protein